jgi:hypothetical protein
MMIPRSVFRNMYDATLDARIYPQLVADGKMAKVDAHGRGLAIARLERIDAALADAGQYLEGELDG